MAAFDVSRETVDRLECYAALLGKWQKAVNLVASDTLPRLWHRHFADSAQLLKYAPNAGNWIDLGTGGGFPGLVIAILLANRDETSVHLVEANARKCSFLSEVARETGARVTIHQTRIEAIGREGLDFVPDIVTSRAVSPLPRLLEQSLEIFSTRTRGLFLKGRKTDEELEKAWERFAFDARVWRSCTEADGRVVEITGLRAKGNS